MKIYGCCDSPKCPLCRGSGIIEEMENHELAQAILDKLAVTDMNRDDDAHIMIRDLCCRVVVQHNASVRQTKT